MNMQSLSYARVWVVLLILTTSACGGKTPGGAPLTRSDAALWELYAAACRAGEENADPYRMQLSLRYGVEGDTRRVAVLLWGNAAGGLRMDVAAGVGVAVAAIYEEGEHFLVYAPNERRAYFHHGKEKPLLNMGVPMPFGARDLADLLNGRFERVFGSRYSGVPRRSPKGVVYTLDSEERGVSGTLELNTEGLPVVWREDGDGWTLRLSYDETGPPLPRKIEISRSNGQKAIVLVKERDRPAGPFTETQLRLTLAEDTPVLPMRRFRQTQP